MTNWSPGRKKNPQAFGYNGIKNGMSGVSFVVGWIYAYGTDAKRLSALPYDKSVEKNWPQAFEKLKDFNKYVTFTPGNAGTLDMLSRGEITMGPVWVDMFYSWKDQGKLPPSLKLTLLAPGMPGQPMYYVTLLRQPSHNWHANLLNWLPARKCKLKVSLNSLTGIQALMLSR